MDLKSIDWKNIFFSFHGRVDRRVYISFILLMVALWIVVSVLAFISSTLANVVLLLALIPAWWAAIAVAIKRFRDMGKTGWFALLHMIPLVNIGVMIWQVIAPSDGPNQYGALPATI